MEKRTKVILFMFRKFIQTAAVIFFAFLLALLAMPPDLSGIYTSKDLPGWKFHFYKDGSLLADRSGTYSFYSEKNHPVLYLEFSTDTSRSVEGFSYYIQNTDDSICLQPFSSFYFEGNGNDTSIELILLEGDNGLKEPAGFFSASYMLETSEEDPDVCITFFKDGSFTEERTGSYMTAGRQITLSVFGREYRVLADNQEHTFFISPGSG